MVCVQSYHFPSYSGAITSGLGYVIWYAAVARISTSTAAVAQLSVPLITALAGVWLLQEALTTRLWELVWSVCLRATGELMGSRENDRMLEPKADNGVGYEMRVGAFED